VFTESILKYEVKRRQVLCIHTLKAENRKNIQNKQNAQSKAEDETDTEVEITDILIQK